MTRRSIAAIWGDESIVEDGLGERRETYDGVCGVGGGHFEGFVCWLLEFVVLDLVWK